MNNSKSLLCCSNMSKCYKEGTSSITILRNISFSLHKGEMMAIVGSSGSGKSTLLHILGGLDTPTKGEVIFEQHILNHLSSTELAVLRNRRIGFIYQFHHLLQDFSALENIAMPMMIGGSSSRQALKSAKIMLSAVGLEIKHGNHHPSELSGGERQRVAIARALINHPTLVLADEPTGNLDNYNSNNIFDLLKIMNNIYGTAFLIVTHDLQLSKKLNKRMEMNDGNLSILNR